MITPQEFETLGGKKACKAWKKSIKHKSKPLSKFLASGALKECDPPTLLPSPSPSQGSSLMQLPQNQSSQIEGIFEELESMLTRSIEEAVRTARHGLHQVLSWNWSKEKVESLSLRVTELETKQSPLSPSTSKAWNRGTSTSTGATVNPALGPDEIERMQSQIKQLTESMNNHQKLLELKERVSRANNLVMVELEESEEHENTLELSINSWKLKWV